MFKIKEEIDDYDYGKIMHCCADICMLCVHNNNSTYPDRKNKECAECSVRGIISETRKAIGLSG